jgi:predicted nucleotidyltransferase
MFERLLERLAQALDSRAIPYMVIGGQAVLLYAEPRLTRDIDVTLGLSVDRLPTLLELARALRLRVRVQNPEEFAHQTMVLPCEEVDSSIRVDFILSNSPYEAEALSRVKRVRIGASEVCYAAVEDLIIHKLVAGRPRDVEDVRSILLQNKGYDRGYVERWLADFERVTGSPLRALLSDLERGRA